MTGYVIASAPCLVCGEVFAFNPTSVPSHPYELKGGRRVPSTNPTHPKGPICRACVEHLNAERRRRGEPTWTVADDAYGPVREGRL
jgi:hypothetical protein